VVRRCIDSVYRCRKIVKILGKRGKCRTHQPFDLEVDVASKERSRTVFRKETLNLRIAGGYRPSWCDGGVVTPSSGENRLAFGRRSP